MSTTFEIGIEAQNSERTIEVLKQLTEEVNDLDGVQLSRKNQLEEGAKGGELELIIEIIQLLSGLGGFYALLKELKRNDPSITINIKKNGDQIEVVDEELNESDVERLLNEKNEQDSPDSSDSV